MMLLRMATLLTLGARRFFDSSRQDPVNKEDTVATSSSTLIELLKYPVAVFSIMFAVIVGSNALGISFGEVSRIGADGVDFREKQKAGFTDLASQLSGAIAEIEALKKRLPEAASASPQIEAKVAVAAQTVSDQTAQLTSVAAPSPKQAKTTGYLFIGNYGSGGWSSAQLADPVSGQPITHAPDTMTAGAEYYTLGNMVVRDGQPDNNEGYYNARKSLGTAPRGTRVRLLATPVPINRGFAVQYWAQVEVL